MKKLTEMEKMQYWLDSEISFNHVLLAVILFQLVTSTWQHVLIVIYGLWSIIYGLIRIAYVAESDPDYLRVPKK